MLEIRLLGQFEVKRDGQPVRLTSRPAQLLLAYLALKSGTKLKREKVAPLLWPDTTDASARSNLRQTLWRLGQALGTTYLSADSEHLELDPGAECWIDVRAFSLRKATRLLSADELIGALEAYGGELLPGFYEDWIHEERERLQAEFERKMEALLLRLTEAGRWAELRDWSKEFLARMDRLSEAAYRALMIAYAHLGDIARMDAAYKQCVAALNKELGEAPSPETQQLYKDLLHQHRARPAARDAASEEARPPQAMLASAPAGPPTNLTEDDTPFVGRARELEAIAQRLADPACRLVSLIGPGGIGKTRLARRAARARLGHFADGVFFVPLAMVTSGEALVSAVAAEIGFNFYGQARPRQQLVDYLREKQMLLVLDNFEQLMESADLPAEILAAAPGVSLIATSRERLHLPSEWILDIPGLPYPEVDDAPDAADCEAVQLFVQTARRLYALSPSADEMAAVARICRLVEGMPLAVEMAAAWVRALPCAEIARQIEQTLMLLTRPLPHVPPRQHSVRTVFEHSWTLLTELERKALRRLAVFRGGFRREAAEKVAGASLSQLASLADKSFVRRQPDGRFDMHELIRQFALEKLHATEDEDPADVETRLAHFFLEFANLHQHDYAALEPEWDNLSAGMRAAHRLKLWAVVLGYAEALSEAWFARARFADARQGYAWAREAAQALQHARGLANVLYHWGRACIEQSEYAEAEAHLTHGLRLYTESGDQRGLADVRYQLARVAVWRGQYAEAEAGLAESQRLYQALGLASGVAETLYKQADVQFYFGNYPRAKELALEALALQQKNDDKLGSIRSLQLLADVALNQGDYGLAEQHCRAALTMCEAVQNQVELAVTLISFSGVQRHLGNLEAARQHAEHSLRLLKRIGNRKSQADVIFQLSRIDAALGHYPAARDECLECLKLYRELQDPFGTAYGLYRLGEAYLALSEPGRARQAWQEAVDVAQKLSQNQDLIEALRQRLAQLSAVSGPAITPG